MHSGLLLRDLPIERPGRVSAGPSWCMPAALQLTWFWCTFSLFPRHCRSFTRIYQGTARSANWQYWWDVATSRNGQVRRKRVVALHGGLRAEELSEEGRPLFASSSVHLHLSLVHRSLSPCRSSPGASPSRGTAAAPGSPLTRTGPSSSTDTLPVTQTARPSP